MSAHTRLPLQGDFFVSPANDNPLLGVQVQLDRKIDHRQPCHKNIAEICTGRGPHSYSLLCATCSRFRGWLPKAAASFITETIQKFGVPSEPLQWGDATHDKEPAGKR